MGNASSSSALAGVSPNQAVGSAELNACWDAYVRAGQGRRVSRVGALMSDFIFVHPLWQDVKKKGELSQALAVRALGDFARSAGVNADKKRLQTVVSDVSGSNGKVRTTKAKKCEKARKKKHSEKKTRLTSDAQVSKQDFEKMFVLTAKQGNVLLTQR